MPALFLAGLIGAVAGSRTLIAPAAVSWGAYGGWLDVSGSWLFFLGHPVSPWVFTAMAVVELIVDKLPTTPSRKLPFPFASRIAGGAIAGAAPSGRMPASGSAGWSQAASAPSQARSPAMPPACVSPPPLVATVRPRCWKMRWRWSRRC